jgi:hypothetical protein
MLAMLLRCSTMLSLVLFAIRMLQMCFSIYCPFHLPSCTLLFKFSLLFWLTPGASFTCLSNFLSMRSLLFSAVCLLLDLCPLLASLPPARLSTLCLPSTSFPYMPHVLLFVCKPTFCANLPARPLHIFFAIYTLPLACHSVFCSLVASPSSTLRSPYACLPTSCSPLSDATHAIPPRP